LENAKAINLLKITTKLEYVTDHYLFNLIDDWDLFLYSESQHTRTHICIHTYLHDYEL